MEEKQIYVSFEEQNYKDHKANILKSQAELIKLQKTLNQIKAIRSKKKRIIVHLASLVSHTNSAVFRLDGKLPDTGLPKHINENKLKSEKKASKGNSLGKEKKNLSKSKESADLDIDNLDRELLEINRRLKALE